MDKQNELSISASSEFTKVTVESTELLETDISEIAHVIATWIYRDIINTNMYIVEQTN